MHTFLYMIYHTSCFHRNRYYTIADVRIPGQERHFAIAIFMSTFYLALFSYVMTYSLELLGPFFGVSSFIMGVVFGAAGTSFPNVFASLVVARQGLGNEAISNALGKRDELMDYLIQMIHVFRCLLPMCFRSQVHMVAHCLTKQTHI
jgi:Ca2+/Na+ antiporter